MSYLDVDIGTAFNTAMRALQSQEFEETKSKRSKTSKSTLLSFTRTMYDKKRNKFIEIHFGSLYPSFDLLLLYLALPIPKSVPLFS